MPAEDFKLKPEKITTLLNSRQDAELRCMDCGEELWDLPIDAYEHPKGWKVPGMDKLYWLSINCPKCNHDNSLTNFGISR